VSTLFHTLGDLSDNCERLRDRHGWEPDAGVSPLLASSSAGANLEWSGGDAEEWKKVLFGSKVDIHRNQTTAIVTFRISLSLILIP
jgi:hypothetical protein